MAAKETERKYVVPLRREYQKAPSYKRTRRAVKALRAFIIKHMKTEDVRIGKHLNKKMWYSGPRNPPHKVEVVAYRKETEDKKPYVAVELVGHKWEDAVKFEEKAEQGKGLMGKLKGKVEDAKKENPKKEEAKEEQKALEKEEPKKEEAAKTPKKDISKEKAKEMADKDKIYSRDMKKHDAKKAKK